MGLGRKLWITEEIVFICRRIVRAIEPAVRQALVLTRVWHIIVAVGTRRRHRSPHIAEVTSRRTSIFGHRLGGVLMRDMWSGEWVVMFRLATPILIIFTLDSTVAIR